MLHTLYGQSLKHSAEFFIEYFAIDLIMDQEGPLSRCRRALPRGRHAAHVPRQEDDPGDRRLRPHLLHLHLGPHLHRRRQRHGAARRAAAAGHGVHPVPPDRHLRRGRAHHRGSARRRRLPHQFQRRALHGALCAAREGPGLARRRLALDDRRDPRRARRWTRTRTTSSCISIIWTRRSWPSDFPASPKSQRSSPASTSGASRSQCCQPCTTTWAAFPPTSTVRY